MRRLTRVSALTIEIDDAADEVPALVEALVPGLLAKVGVGPMTAAQTLVSWSQFSVCTGKTASLRSPGSAHSMSAGSDQARVAPAFPGSNAKML